MKSISHDSVNRFLLRENYTPQDLFDEVKGELVLEGGLVSVDDSLLDKPYSNPKKKANSLITFGRENTKEASKVLI